MIRIRIVSVDGKVERTFSCMRVSLAVAQMVDRNYPAKSLTFVDPTNSRFIVMLHDGRELISEGCQLSELYPFLSACSSQVVSGVVTDDERDEQRQDDLEIEEGEDDPPLDDSPTQLEPGSEEKIELMRQRYLAGKRIIHPDDLHIDPPVQPELAIEF